MALRVLIAMRLVVEVAENIYLSSHEETGEPEEASCYFAIVEAFDGSRWAHEMPFLGHLMGRLHAQAAAARLVERIQAALDAGTWAGPVNNPRWVEVQPAYGSDAYQRNEGRWAAEQELADGNYDAGTRHERELLNAAYGEG